MKEDVVCGGSKCLGWRMALALGVLTVPFAVPAYGAFTEIHLSGEPGHVAILDGIYSSSFWAVGAALPNGMNSQYTDGTITVTRVDDDGQLDLLDLLGGPSGTDDDDVWTDGIAQTQVEARFAGYSQEFGYKILGVYYKLFDVVGTNFSVTGSGTVSFGPGATWEWARLDDSDGGPLVNPYYSDESSNGDGLDHMVTYHVTGKSGVPTTSNIWLVFWEDQPGPVGGGSDRDFNDLVVEITSVECEVNDDCDDGDECTDDICNADWVCENPDNGLCGACCLSDGTCVVHVLAVSCAGTFMGAGTVCTAPEACCLPGDEGWLICRMLDPLCCEDQGGVSQGAGSVCTAPEACCLSDGTCEMLDPLCCVLDDGEPQGPGAQCTAEEACCLPTGDCIMRDPLCCDDLGGTPQGPGTVCTESEACCLEDDTCIMVDPLCCDELGGTPQGAGTVCTAPEACCLEDDTCIMVDPLCCDDLGGVPQGAGSVCLGMEACCDAAGVCYMADALCCLANGDTPQGPGTVCTVPEACCFPNDTCQMLDPLCCVDMGGAPQGAGSTCGGMEA
ncbi:MAG: DUF4114 domain-containing protein, partial [Phycisphaerae bacterium]